MSSWVGANVWNKWKFSGFLWAGVNEERKKQKAEFLYRMSLGCSAITLTCAPALVSPRWTETDIVFHCSVLLQLLGGCRWAQCWDFIVVEHGGSGCLGQVSLQAWTAGGGDVPTSSFVSGTTVSSLHFFPPLLCTWYFFFFSDYTSYIQCSIFSF